MTDDEEQIVNDAFRMIGTAISRIDVPGDIDAALDEICDAVNRIEPDLLVAATRGWRRWPPAVVDAPEGSDPGGRGAPWTPAGDSTRGLHQVGQRRLQPLAADPASSFPEHDQRLSNRLVVAASALFYCRLLLPIVAGLPQ